MLDSLVRVSRRDVPKYHTNNILSTDNLQYLVNTKAPVPPQSRETMKRQQDCHEDKTFTTAWLICVNQSPSKRQKQICWIPIENQKEDYRKRYLVTLKPIQFHTLFTLLTEYFSTFPHGTCLLTVLCIIFSLRGRSRRGQAVLGRQDASPTPWLTERHGYDPTLLGYA